MSKRVYEDDGIDSKASKRSLDLDSKISSKYTGYCPVEKFTDIDVLELPTKQEEFADFFQEFVAKRKPCKITGVSPACFQFDTLKPAMIESTLPADEVLQVERKNEGGFGSGQRRLKMSFGEFMNKMIKGETQYYLTTQYAEDDPDLQEKKDEEEESCHSDEDAEENDSEQDESGQEIFPPAFDSASDAESINFNDTHDDFDDISGDDGGDEGLDNEEILGCNLRTGPLTAEEANQRVRELYQPPLSNLVDKLPETPEILQSLIPQQINLWIGSAPNITAADGFLNGFDPHDPKLGLGRNIPGGGSSSGLHHDHADNIYIPVNGHKRFTLFSPRDSIKMYTVGDIRTVFASGVIDYTRNEKAPMWRQLRDDGAIVAEVAKHELQVNDQLDANERAELKKIISEDEQEVTTAVLDSKIDPPSFSQIPPTVVHLDKIEDKALQDSITAAAKERWPLFFEANRIVVDLKPGEMLYLPTGWFHEVTSFGKEEAESTEDNIHIAVNYWFIPPTGSAMEKPYTNKDCYWPMDYERTRASLDRARGM